MMEGIEQTRAVHIARECPVCLQEKACLFCGQDTETLTRDELLVAYRHACHALDLHREWARLDSEMNHLFTSARISLVSKEKPLMSGNWPSGERIRFNHDRTRLVRYVPFGAELYRLVSTDADGDGMYEHVGLVEFMADVKAWLRGEDVPRTVRVPESEQGDAAREMR